MASSKSIVETPLLRMTRAFESSIAEDTVRNEYTMHLKIHEWLRDGSWANDLQKLNRTIYAELFLTPDSDPWLGLNPSSAYTALQNGGLTMSKGK